MSDAIWKITEAEAEEDYFGWGITVERDDRTGVVVVVFARAEDWEYTDAEKQEARDLAEKIRTMLDTPVAVSAPDRAVSQQLAK